MSHEISTKPGTVIDTGTIHRAPLVSELAALRARCEAAEARERAAETARSKHLSDRQEAEAVADHLRSVLAEARAKARAEVERLRKEAADLDADEREVLDRDAREMAAVRAASDAAMREALGAEMFSRLWGPPLEAMGRMMDTLRVDRADALAARDEALAALIDVADFMPAGDLNVPGACWCGDAEYPSEHQPYCLRARAVLASRGDRP